MTLTVEGREEESGSGLYSRPTDIAADGSYSQPNVPAVKVTATVVDEAGLAGSGSATVVEAGSTSLDLHQSLGNAVLFSIDLGRETPVSGSPRYFVQADGSVSEELGRLHSRLTVNGKSYALVASGKLESSGRQVVVGPIRSGGVLYTRKVFVPADGRFARVLEILENDNAVALETTLRVRGDLRRLSRSLSFSCAGTLKVLYSMKDYRSVSNRASMC